MYLSWVLDALIIDCCGPLIGIFNPRMVGLCLDTLGSSVMKLMDYLDLLRALRASDAQYTFVNFRFLFRVVFRRYSSPVPSHRLNR